MAKSNYPWSEPKSSPAYPSPGPGGHLEVNMPAAETFPDGSVMKSMVVTHPTTGLPATTVYTENQAEGAIPNGTRVKKRNTEEGDRCTDGEEGVMVGSMLYPDHMPQHPDLTGGHPVKYLYFVKWDKLGDVPIGTIDYRVEEA